MGIVSRAMIYGRVASLEAKNLNNYQRSVSKANSELKAVGQKPMTKQEEKAFKATYYAELKSETKARRELRER